MIEAILCLFFMCAEAGAVYALDSESVDPAALDAV
jgi:hypothetical protein